MKLLLTCSFLCMVLCAGAQGQITIEKNDSTFHRDRIQYAVDPVAVYSSHVTSRVRKTYRPWIAPAGLIIAGFFATRIDAFTDINEDVQRHIWVVSPHRRTGIDNVLPFVPAAAVYGLNLAGMSGAHDLFDRSMILMLAGAITEVSSFTVKSVTHENRPDHSAYNSFPSGHTAAAFATAEFLMQEYKHRSIWYGIGGYVTAAAVGYLRLYNNKHWVNDVVAGAGFGIASTRVAYLSYPKIQKALSKTRMKHSVVIPFYQNSTAGIYYSHQF